jgi:sigma-B regulation protein RsbU (phosphoserine phosphatase)
MIASSILRHQGVHQLFFAENGAEALCAVMEHTPDLILLDLLMPELDGYACCRAIRQQPAFAETPIIVQTGIEDTQGLADAYAAGASDFVRKPIHANELIARTQVHLERLALLRLLNSQQRQLQQELQAARAMQEMMLPEIETQHQLAEKFGLDVAVHHQPCQSLSGDLWSMQAISPHELAFYQVDFSGHGMLAAMNGFRFHALTQARLAPMADPGTYLTALNAELYRLLPRHCFATMFYGVIDTEHNVLRYATAAHTTPLIIRRESVIEPVSGRGFPLSAVRNAAYKTCAVPFSAGDQLLLYSDALIERWENFEEKALITFLSHQIETGSLKGIACPLLLDKIISEWREDSSFAPALKDDLSLLAIKRKDIHSS